MWAGAGAYLWGSGLAGDEAAGAGRGRCDLLRQARFTTARDKCSRSKCSSLELACSSRAISLSSCFIRFSCSISLRSNSISRISYSTTGCQLSLDNQRRQGGSEDRNSDLLIELEGWAPKEVDMVITREKCDQGEQKAGNERDRAL